MRRKLEKIQELALVADASRKQTFLAIADLKSEIMSKLFDFNQNHQNDVLVKISNNGELILEERMMTFKEGKLGQSTLTLHPDELLEICKILNSDVS